MPMPRDLDLRPDQFAMYFETNDRIDAGRLGRMISALARDVERYPEFEPGSKLILKRARSESPLLIEFVVTMAALATIAQFVIWMADRAKAQSKPAFNKRLAEIMADDGVTAIEFAHPNERTGGIEMLRLTRQNMPAFDELRLSREQSRNPNTQTRAKIDAETEPANPSPVTFDSSSTTFDSSTTTFDSSESRKFYPPQSKEARESATAVPLERKILSLQGRFISQDNSVYFETNGSVFHANFADPEKRRSWTDNITVQASIDPARPGEIFIYDWARTAVQS